MAQRMHEDEATGENGTHGNVQMGRSDQKEELTWYIIFITFLASNGGLLYGYNLVVAGGISIMNDFLNAFYPSVYEHKSAENHDNYCKYDNQAFQLFSSSLCLAALASTFLASSMTRKLGHRSTMIGAGVFYLLGTLTGAGALNLPMVILSRVLMGCGIGFANQAIPLYLSEIAPVKFRGKLTLFFSLMLAFGLFLANLVNYVSSKKHPWGWRISFLACAFPSCILIIAGIVLVDSPYRLIAQGRHEQARAVLRKLRGTHNVDDELHDLVKARAIVEAEEASAPGPKRNQLQGLLWRRHRPQLVIALAMPFFQQVSGYDAILFYGPSLFGAAGFGDDAALYSTLITGFFAMVSTLVAIVVVDRVGRRRILLYCSVAMLLGMVSVAIILGTELRGQVVALSRSAGIAEVVVLCIVVLAYKASWGPMAWLIPSEILPQEIRSMGQSMVVSFNMLVKFIIAQSFLSMLCGLKYGIFLFFGGWLIVMGLFTYFFIPETKGVPIDSIKKLWDHHWFWKRFTLEEHPMSTSTIEMKIHEGA